MNGCGSGWVVPSTVTPRSSIASRNADWVRGVARLISSASTTLANIGPGRNSNSPRCWSKTVEPVTSPGSRSAVHWMRRKLQAERSAAKRAHQQRLGDAGHVVEQHVPAGQQGDGDEARLVGLADDDAPHLLGDRPAQLDGRGHVRAGRVRAGGHDWA